MDMDVVESPRDADDDTRSSTSQPSHRLRRSGKGFKCPSKVCASEFPSRKALTAHKISSHNYRRCTFPDCPGVYISERRCALHLARCHPQRPAAPQTPPSVPPPAYAASSLITDLQTATLLYLKQIKLLALTSDRERPTKMAKVAAGGEVPKAGLAILMHAVNVAKCLSEFGAVSSELSAPVLPQQAASAPSQAKEKRTKVHRRKKRSREEDDPPFIISLPGRQTAEDGRKRRGPKPSVHVCSKCAKEFPYKKELKAHKDAEHPGKRSAAFEVQMLQLSSPDVTAEGSYACIDPECERTFESESQLTVHINEQHGI